MDIKPTQQGGRVNNTTPPEQNSQPAPEQATAPVPADVAVELESLSVAELQHSIANESPFDSEKIEALKEAIANGSYSINLDAIVDGLSAGGHT